MDSKKHHPSYERLLVAAYGAGVFDRIEIADTLGQTTHVIANWARRGVSKDGALIAQEKFGCSSVWIRYGRGPGPENAQQSAITPPAHVAQAVAANSDFLRPIRDFYADDLKSMLMRFSNSDDLRTAYAVAMAAIERHTLIVKERQSGQVDSPQPDVEMPSVAPRSRTHSGQ